MKSIQDMLVGGIEPTATLIEWTMSELLKHPQIMKQLKAVIKEAARLHPSAPLLLFREASKDVEVHKYEIAAGTQVIINAWAIQRQPASWDEPEEFRPERFLNSTIDMKGNNFELIPFGAGRRGCPGMAFASMQTELVLANLAGMFDWEVPGFEQLRLLCTQPLIVLPLIIFIYLLYKWVFYTKSRSNKNLPPSPPKLPILGNLHQLGTSPHRALRSLAERYGELMMVHLGQRPILVVSSEQDHM